MVFRKTLNGFIVGSLMGAAVALLTTPRSGEETRSLIAEKSQNLREKVVSTVEDTRERVDQLASNIAEKADEGVDRMKDIGSQVKKAEAAVKEAAVKSS